MDAAYELRSVAVTSNIKPSGFDTIMPKTLATTTVDRLLHHAHQVLTDGRSQRLAQALTGSGWPVLPSVGNQVDLSLSGVARAVTAVSGPMLIGRRREEPHVHRTAR